MSPYRSVRHRVSLAVLLSVALAATASAQVLTPKKTGSLAGEVIPSLRGALPNQSFLSDGEVESINTANGNVMLSIPLGQVYTVGPHVKYQLRATHNSDAWDHAPITAQQILVSLPHRNGNAGVGWEVHFGKLFAPEPPTGLTGLAKDTWPNRQSPVLDGGKRWLYVSPDGASHYLFALVGRDPGTQDLPVRYSKDSSQIRLRQIDADTIILEHPNGVLSQFEKTNSRLGTLECGNGVTGCWRFQEMRDRYGNKVQVTYSQPNASTERWRISDSTGRVHWIYFHLDAASRGGSDATAFDPLRLPNGDELGDPRRLVDRVEVAAAGGTSAVYDFSYSIQTISRSRPHDPTVVLNPPSDTIRVPLLTRIAVPDSANYVVSHYTDFTRSGRVQRIQFPTQGKYEYNYGTWLHPTQCVWTNDPTAELWYSRTGLTSKKHLRPNNTVIATWNYSSSLHPSIPADQISGPNCHRADYRQTDVTGPTVNGRFTKHRFFHAVTIGPKFPLPTDPIGNWQVTDAGLPYRKDVKIGNSNGNYAFLSEQIFDCTGGCTNVREVYVRYAMEWRTCSTLLIERDPGECFRVNAVPVRERTVFKDDGSRYREKKYTEHDGAGNTRRMEILDNFTGSLREVDHFTDYNATGNTEISVNSTTGYFNVGIPSNYLPSRNSPWILTPYTTKIRTDSGHTYRTDYSFDSQGSIVCVRQRKTSTGTGSRDLVTRYFLGASPGNNAGLPTQEIVAGGENGGLGSGVCNTNGSEGNNKFTFVHAYQFSQLKSTRIGGFPYRFRADVDRNTGLPSATYNPADQRTARIYDRLGRPTRFAPEGSLGEAETIFTYNNPGGGEASVTIARRFNGNILADEKLIYDYFGRLRREIQSRPTGQASHADSERDTVYDAIGRVERVTTVQRASNVDNLKSTRYQGYDAFGRPSRILRPDGSDERFAYRGIRETDSKLHIRTSQGGTSEITTTTRYDALGRATLILNPAYSVVNRYDPDGKVVEIERRVNGNVVQTREYGWDDRGLLVFEKHPEIGNSAGLGTISFAPDALGNPRQVVDGLHSLTYGYDGDGRLRSKSEGSRVWEEYTWANGNSGADYKKGKIVEAIRHNYFDVSDWAIAETYEYRGKLGKMSQRTTQLQFLHVSDPLGRYAHTFDQSWTYNVLGEVISQTYPNCITTPQNGLKYCNDPSDLQAPQHVVSRTMNQRLPVRVSSSLGMSADYQYHPNYQLERIDYSNDAHTELDQGTDGMRRPERIRHYSVGGVLRFDSGTYRYDDAGNIWEIGPDNYVYDAASRLTRGTARSASRWEEYQYDGKDNLVRIERDDGSVVHHAIDGKNRRIGQVGLPPDTVYDAAGNVDYLGPEEDPFFDLDHDALNMITRFYRQLDDAEFLYGYAPGNYRLISMDVSTGERFWTFRDQDGSIIREHRTIGFGPYQGPTQPGEIWEFEKDYVHGPNGLIATRDRGGLKTYFHHDHVGSPRIVTDDFGNQVGAQDYYPYGLDATVSGVQEPHSKFAGHELDRHETTYYMKARSYVHAWGRFANVDPARSGWNLYAYADDNPIRFVDPTGLAEQPAAEDDGPIIVTDSITVTAAPGSLYYPDGYNSNGLYDVQQMEEMDRLIVTEGMTPIGAEFSVWSSSEKISAPGATFFRSNEPPSAAEDVLVGVATGLGLQGPAVPQGPEIGPTSSTGQVISLAGRTILGTAGKARAGRPVTGRRQPGRAIDLPVPGSQQGRRSVPTGQRYPDRNRDGTFRGSGG